MDNVDLDSRREVANSVSACRITESRSTIDLLRAETATHHHRLESGLRIEDRLSGKAAG
jgi:hypothetical protein